MSELINPTVENGDSGNRRCPQTNPVLLSRKQWLYVQNRYNLTPRERQIAELICQGIRNGSIAKYLRISPGTVKTHTRNIYRKVRVKSKIGMLLQFVTEARKLSDQYDERTSVPVGE